MTLSLFTATVPAMRQQVAAIARLLDKAAAFAADRGIEVQTLIDARLAPDMNDFAYQVKSVAVHSVGAIAGVRAGFFAPDTTTPPPDLAGLKALMATTDATLAAMTADEIDGLAGRDMIFGFGTRQVGYTGGDFLLSFSLPNLYFHAATAYDLLRWQGMPLTKGDYLGRPRFKA